MADGQLRAGVWRRWLATTIDVVIAAIPVQIAAVVLFAVTAGHVQLSDGVTYTRCIISTQVPEGLNPPPPAGANQARDCRTYFLGGELARKLTVRHVDTSTTDKSHLSWSLGVHLMPLLMPLSIGHNDGDSSDAETYTLDQGGKQVEGLSLNWLVYVALFAYLATMESRTGQSFGDRAMAIKLVDAANPATTGVPLSRACGRYAVLMAGLIPFARLLDAGGLGQLSLFADLIVTIWFFIIFLQVLRRRDPPHDWIAGTSVVLE